MQALDAQEINRVVTLALQEDVGPGDVTTLATVPEPASVRAVMRAREPLVLAGVELARATFLACSPQLKMELKAKDGDRVPADGIILEIAGPAGPVLTGERVALNFVQRLSGIATLTAQFVAAVEGTGVEILDTRKTTPGLRMLEKYAVRCGGGANHRFGLHDMILIKDNHLAAQKESGNAVEVAVRRAREIYPRLKLEVEADTLEQVDQALAAGADIILLDNMNQVQLRLAVQKCKGRARTEASGGVSLATARAIASTGVDCISVGAITHSARAVDIGLDFML